MRLAERLDGRRVLITGVTGFVGEALLHRLLHDVPGITPVVLVRPKAGQPGRDRIAGAAGQADLQPRASSAAGGVEALMRRGSRSSRATWPTLPDAAADLDAGRALRRRRVVRPAGRRGVRHQRARRPRAARRSRVDAAGRARAARSTTCTSPRRTSAGRRRGPIPEGPVDHTVDWRAEAAGGLARSASGSRTGPAAPTVLAKLLQAGRAGARPGRAADRRQRRRGGAARPWVQRQQLRRPAPSGPAAWAGPTATRSPRRWASASSRSTRPADQGGRAEPSIVRPSIIESALRAPYPGWIEGFKMAEPLILAYGRGELPGVPGRAATPSSTSSRSTTSSARSSPCWPTRRSPARSRYFHVSSGARNPLTFRRALRARSATTSTSTRSTWATAARSGCRSGGSPAPSRSSGCSCTSERAHKVADCARRPARRAATGPASWPASWTGRGGGWSSCAATSTSTASTPRPSCSFVRRAHAGAVPRARARGPGDLRASTPRSSTGPTTCATCTARP